MNIKVRVDTSEGSAFTMLKTGGISAFSVLASILIHAAVVALALWIAPYLAPDPGAVRMIPVRVELRFPADALMSRPPRPDPKPERAAEAKADGISAPAPAGSPAPKLVLPKLPPARARELTIILPNLVRPPTTPIEDIRVPSIMVWTPPKPQPRKFVLPGARQVQPSDLRTEAELSLELPKDLPVRSDLPMQPSPNAPALSKLPVQISATRPVRAFQPPPTRSDQPPPAPFETIAGDLASLVLLSPQDGQRVDRLQLPDGSQIAAIHANRPPDPAALSGAGAGGAKDNAAEAAAVAGRGEFPGGIKITGGPGNANNGPPGKGSPSAGGLVAVDPFAPVPLPAVPIRIAHPVNGVFDVVVVQSSTLNEFPGVAPLSGSPVYTVFFPVGRAKMWVMQFCVPKERAIAKVQGNVILLSDNPPLKAPFPIETLSPPGVLGKVAVHGFLSDSGQLENLRVVAGEKAAEAAGLIPLLKKWLMRPATRDGKPIGVEIMLLISG